MAFGWNDSNETEAEIKIKISKNKITIDHAENPSRGKRNLPLIFVTSISGILAIIFISYYFRCSMRGDDDGNGNVTASQLQDLIIQEQKLKMVERAQWLGQPPSDVTNLELPAKFVVITHTASDQCETQAKCVFVVTRLEIFTAVVAEKARGGNF